MKILKYCLLLSLFCSYTFYCQVQNQQSDKEAVQEAAMAYVESIYQMDSTKIYKYVDRNLYKLGAYYSAKDNAWSTHKMTFQELVNIVNTYNKDGRIPSDAPKKVELLDLQEKMANVKVDAFWGMDYLLLLKGADDAWKIHEITWQSYAPEKK